MLIVTVLLLLSWCGETWTQEEVDYHCQAVLDSLPTSVKKTKAWKNCQDHDEAVLTCLERGFEVMK